FQGRDESAGARVCPRTPGEILTVHYGTCLVFLGCITADYDCRGIRSVGCAPRRICAGGCVRDCGTNPDLAPQESLPLAPGSVSPYLSIAVLPGESVPALQDPD